MLQEFITPEKKNSADSQSLLERWLKKFAPFRAQVEVPLPASINKVGRPTVLNAAVKNQLYILLSLGMTRKQAAWYLGFDPSTVSHAAKKDESFAYNLNRAEELSGLQPHLALHAASMTNWRAAVWVLRNQMQPEGNDDGEEGSKAKLGKGGNRTRRVKRAAGGWYWVP